MLFYLQIIFSNVKYSIQIMNVYECNGKKYFHEVKDEIFHSKRRQPSGMENFIFHRMKMFLPLHE